MHRLSYAWVVTAESRQAKVAWTLTESESSSTKLDLKHSGFEGEAKQQIVGVQPEWRGMLDGFLQNLVGAQ